MLFDEQIARKPDRYPWTRDFIEAIWKGFWTPDEFNFRSDYSQFKSDLSDKEQEVVVKTMVCYWANRDRREDFLG